MKVRWTTRSVRLRITPEELETLRRGDEISAAFSPTDSSGWSVCVTPWDNTSLSMQGGALLFSLSHDDVRELCEPMREGVYFSQGATNYFIEKDFPCAHPRAAEALEEQTPTFAPPEGFEERKNA